MCWAVGIESVSFLYQNVYGLGQSLTNPYTGILSRDSREIDLKCNQLIVNMINVSYLSKRK